MYCAALLDILYLSDELTNSSSDF